MRVSYLLFFVVIALGLAACTTPQGGVTVPNSPYQGGSQGLVLEIGDLGIFNDQTNTEEIFEGEPIPVEVTLKNKGEYEVQPGEAAVDLLGIFQSDFFRASGNPAFEH